MSPFVEGGLPSRKQLPLNRSLALRSEGGSTQISAAKAAQLGLIPMLDSIVELVSKASFAAPNEALRSSILELATSAAS